MSEKKHISGAGVVGGGGCSDQAKTKTTHLVCNE